MAVNKNNIVIQFKTSKAINEVLNRILDSLPNDQKMSKSQLVEFLVIQGLEHAKLIYNENKKGEVKEYEN